MMLVSKNRLFINTVSETRQMVMSAIARAIFERSLPLTDGSAIHREYRDDDQLSRAEVSNFFVGEELVMFFPKGRRCMVHLKPDGMSKMAIVFNDELADDTDADRLEGYLGRAQQILNKMERVRC